MNKAKFFVLFLLITAICLVSFGAVLAVQPPKDCEECKAWVSEMCSHPGMDKDCEKNMYESACGNCSSSSSGPDAPVIYIRPADEIGEYDTVNDKKEYISFKSWDDCMKYFGDADKCSKIVSNKCQSCMGICRAVEAKGGNLSQSCSEICKADCSTTGSGDVDPGSDGEDKYGKFYLENGKKKYTSFNNFHGCWSVIGDTNYCVSNYGYDCSYRDFFYTAHLCAYTDGECYSRVESEYAEKCK